MWPRGLTRLSSPAEEERERERECLAILAQVDLPLPPAGALEGGPADLLFAAAGLLGGRPFERG